MSANKPSKILIIAPAWVGDLVMTKVLFQLLKTHNPNVIIDVLGNESLFGLLKHMPEVHQGIALPIKHGELQLGERHRIGVDLRTANYDQAIVIPNSLKSALIPWFTRIKKRTGWRGEMRYGLLNDLRILDKKQLPLMVERLLKLGLDKQTRLPKIWQNPKLSVNAEDVKHTVAKFNLTLQKPVLILCPGAEYGEAKRWPAKYFAEIAKIKMQDGLQVWLLGGPKDIPIANAIQQLSQQVCVDLTGKTDLDEVVNLLSLATAVVTNDSGLMHIAAALNRPLIAIYGSTTPQFTPPLSDNATIVSLNLPCSPCFQRICPQGHFKCLQDLKPKLVLDAINTVLISR